MARLTAGGRLRQARQNSRRAVQPLAAPAQPPRPARKKVGAGWLVYAFPLVIALTAITGFRVLKEQPPAEPTPTPVVAGASTPVSIGEAPPGAKFAKQLASAQLPDGGPIPAVGKGTFHVVPGTSAQIGKGKLTTYTIEVEDGFQPVGGDALFAETVQNTLSNPKSWIGGGQISLKRVDSGKADLHVRLASQQTTRDPKVCGFDIPYDTSCRLDDNVYLNDARWERGAVAFQGNILLYQQYAVNHEVGHFFGGNHLPCADNGGLAPVMMQQTLSTANNDLADLTTQNPQGIVVPRDGKVCQPNPWPFPVAGQGQ
ncbi:DUF3152 domain-containing protein [Kutzneria sp. NPDC051319]|uniref:DUF3152 domain-containing protein n=1 Tax=Kutzneria sp. NPDC051319 TaxID=3155047 RepID=UPI00342CE8C6